jgi:hypothetical protein
MPRKKRMYDELRRRGGRVADQDEWRELGRACGCSARRTLAGFFGGRKPSMVHLADGSRVLTSDGWLRANSI